MNDATILKPDQQRAPDLYMFPVQCCVSDHRLQITDACIATSLMPSGGIMLHYVETDISLKMIGETGGNYNTLTSCITFNIIVLSLLVKLYKLYY